MVIGTFGGITFEVSDKNILTFTDFTRSGSARWSVHDVNLKKPIPEFLGPGLESISFKVTLRASHGATPEATLSKLRAFRDTGKVSSLVIGGKPITTGYWYLEDVSETHKNIDHKGRILSAEASLNLKEYPKPVAVRTKPSTPKNPNNPNNNKPKPKTSQYIGDVMIKASGLNCRSSPSLKGKVIKVLEKNKSYKAYGTIKTDITWYVLGGGLYVSANSKYTSLKKK